MQTLCCLAAGADGWGLDQTMGERNLSKRLLLLLWCSSWVCATVSTPLYHTLVTELVASHVGLAAKK